MAFQPRRTITVPILLGATGVTLSLAMLVGWILVLVRNVELTQQVRANGWLMAAGSLSFLVIVSIIVVFAVFLSRETLEIQRQVRFIDSVTHELKSPLASLKLCVETLGRAGLPERNRQELQRMMLDDIDRLNVFIDDILDASRVGYGPGEHACAEVDLEELAERCAQRVRERYSTPAGALEVQVPSGMVLFTEVTALDVVLRNLLDNAVKYSNEPVVVRLVAQEVGADRVKIAVSDQGIGIPQQHLRRIFDRFYRAPLEVVHARRGTGLGLYVAASLVKSLGGRLEAESEGPGKGSTLRFTIPREVAGAGQRSGQPAPAQARGRS